MSEIEYEVQMMMDHVDEEKAAEETASMIEVLNSATEDFRRNEESARIAASMDEFFFAAERNQKKQQALAQKHSRRKWRAVRRCGGILLTVAALFGFEQLLGLSHELTLAAMILALVLAVRIFAVQVVPEVRWYRNHKAVIGR